MHFDVHHSTASELVYNRIDSDKDFMGLTTFKGELPTLTEAKVAKNYLNEKELKTLNNLVSGYLDFAELRAEEEIPMTMKDWIEHVDKILLATGKEILKNNGKISRKQMEKKAENEIKEYNIKTLSQVEKDYLESIKSLEKIAKKKVGKNE